MLVFGYEKSGQNEAKLLETAKARPDRKCMRIVGTSDRHEIELNPQQAWRHARLADEMFVAIHTPYPHGVTRATHAELQRRDTARVLQIARRFNPT